LDTASKHQPTLIGRCASLDDSRKVTLSICAVETTRKREYWGGLHVQDVFSPSDGPTK
jgi:hypothetical protein